MSRHTGQTSSQSDAQWEELQLAAIKQKKTSYKRYKTLWSDTISKSWRTKSVIKHSITT